MKHRFFADDSCDSSDKSSGMEDIDFLTLVHPGNAYLYYRKGMHLFVAKKYTEVIRCFDEATAINPDHAFAHYCKGLALFELKKYRSAIKSYDVLLTTDSPYGASAYNNKGCTLSILEEHEGGNKML